MPRAYLRNPPVQHTSDHPFGWHGSRLPYSVPFSHDLARASRNRVPLLETASKDGVDKVSCMKVNPLGSPPRLGSPNAAFHLILCSIPHRGVFDRKVLNLFFA